MKKERLFFLFVLIALNAFTQKNQHLITGVVKDSEKVIKNAHIVNLSTKQGTFSNDMGKYRIYVSIGDSLQITSIQHKTGYKVISNIDIDSRETTTYLSPNTYELDEVVIKKHNLTGNLLLDLKRKKKGPREINAVTLGLPNAGSKKLSQIDRKLHTATTGGGLVPFDLILNLLSGRIKKLKEEKRVVEENNDVDLMYKQLSQFLTKDFKIKKEDHFRFLYYCRSDSLFSVKKMQTELDLIKFLHLKSKEFNSIQKKNIDPDK